VPEWFPHPEWLIAPTGWETFERKYWEKRPLIVERNDPNYYSNLLSLEQFDAILSNLSVYSSRVRLVGNDRERTSSPSTHGNVYDRANGTEALFAGFRRGETIIVNSLHEEWPPLRDMCRALSAKFCGAFQVNVYLTPARSRGLRPHYDTHDVFVLQIHGTKKWQLFDEAVHLPLGGQVHRGEFFTRNDATEIINLRQGDMIYIPRGWGHVADALDEISVHLTVGAYPLNWALIVLKGVEDVLAADVRFRESLPVGFARDEGMRAKAVDCLAGLLDALRSRLDAAALIDYATAGAELSSPPRLMGHLMDLARLNPTEPDARFRRREGVVGRLHDSGSAIGLTFHGKTIVFPARFRDELRFLAESKQLFAPSSLPGDGTSEEKHLIARKLIEEGFLTFAS
jgi:ribosomal protein L16 Arg81 hydroxylase